MYHADHLDKYRLYVPHDLVQEFFAMKHDAKHHYGPMRMMKDLDSLAIKLKKR